METQKRTPWRRWIVLVLMIAGFILGGIYVPVQPEIVVAPEKLSYTPLFELPVIGKFYLVNTLPTLAITLVLLIWSRISPTAPLSGARRRIWCRAELAT